MQQAITFFKEAYEELKKVTWLTRKEVLGSTFVIMVLIIIISIFVAFVDFLCVKFVTWIL